VTEPNPSTEITAHTEEPAGAHGGEAPGGPAYWAVISLSTAIVAVAFYLAARYLLWPGETEDDHIKRRILHEEET